MMGIPYLRSAYVFRAARHRRGWAVSGTRAFPLPINPSLRHGVTTVPFMVLAVVTTSP